jgi:HdeA/HdeB family
MWRYSALMGLAIAVSLGGLLGAVAQDSEIDCSSFLRNPDGSWTVIKKVYIPVQDVRVVPGTVFRPGQTFLGDDMTQRLARACPNLPVAQPAATAASAPPTPLVPLSTYAESNGEIDVERLSCAHLNLAPPDQIALFVAWYSGWYTGRARRSRIDLARVQYEIGAVASYCKAYPAARLSEALQRLLK